MTKKHIAAAIIILFAVGFQAQSQILKKLFGEIEVIGGVGTTNYFGDIGGQDPAITGFQGFFDHMDIDLWQTRVALPIGVRFASFKKFSFALQLNPMLLSGNDERSKYVSMGRFHAFTTSMAELSLQGEYYFAQRMTGFAPYGYAGIGGIGYSVKYFENTEVAPSDFTRTPMYTATTYIFGLGARFPTKNSLTQTLDFGFHFAGTDRLDGFKTERKSNDLFFVLAYKVNFQLYTSWYVDHRGLVR